MQEDNIKLVWITPEAEKLIAYMARVSNPANQENHESGGKIIKYMVDHKHWSPFEMVDACFEITTTRDIARQILRHRSFSFQEFSQRYQKVEQLPVSQLREARLQDTKNRQNSIVTDDELLTAEFNELQAIVVSITNGAYQRALDMGIAKEVARSVLPEGLTTTRMYMKGSIRSWMHYCQVRMDESTQKEHRLIARQISDVLTRELPVCWQAVMGVVND
jgi:thymidylate synthase (FAD)